MADEVALSVEETNRLRVSLGLKPLSEGPAKQQHAPQPAPQEPAAPDPEALRAKLAEAREKRRREAELRATQTLGAAGEDVDDLATWVGKIKKPGAKAKPQPGDADGARAAKRRRRDPQAGDGAAAGSEEGEDGDGEGGHTAADLAEAGVRLAGDVAELGEGESMVLTLADAGILDDKGELADGPDTLENVVSEQDKARAKARRAATKTAKPLWEEDGKVRSLLDKYDEEEEAALVSFDAAGNVVLSEAQRAAQQRRQAELAAKLAAGAALLGDDEPANGTAAGAGGAGDYMSAAEAGAAKGEKKKKKKRRLRTTKVAAEDGDDAGGGGGGLDLDALEAAATAEAAAAGAGDLGSRAAREERRAAAEAARAAAVAERAARFEAALGRANLASEALRPSAAAAAAAASGLPDDDADDELAASLARARRLAHKATPGSSAPDGGGGGGGGSSLEEIARQLAVKREEDEARLREQIAAGGLEAFSETTEFVRAIQVAPVKAEQDASYMDVDEQPAAAAAAADAGAAAGAAAAAAAGEAAGAAGGSPPPLAPPESKPPLPPKGRRQYRSKASSGWVTAEGGEEEADGDAEQAGGGGGGGESGRRRAPELEDTGVVGERAIGKGLAACLGLIKDKGMLKDTTQWAGRTNDKKPVALIGLHDVYTGGSQDDAMLQRIETALTQRDEFGRVMTPKERFRVMCHQFHGMPPSKNKQEERQRKYLEEVAVAQATSSENPSAQLDKLKELQRSLGSAHIPLTGRAKPAAAEAPPLPRDAPSGLASARTPMLGGGLTPLSGSKKVELMLGISKGGSGSMPPPPPRK